MLETTLYLLTTCILILALALFTNWYRDRRTYKIQLKPNCLLTRHPVVFVTGYRSLFYFRKYWNAYPEVLAEHGYEVFTLHLPWNGNTRKHRMKQFLNQHSQDSKKFGSKKFHFICDSITLNEFKALFAQSPCTASIMDFGNEVQASSSCSSSSTDEIFTLNLAYKFHTWRYAGKRLPAATDLGVHFPTASSSLLKKMQLLGEQDFLN